MTIHLKTVVLHQLVKTETDELVVKYRSEALENNLNTENLVAELHRTFNAKAGKGFGLFKPDSQFKDDLVISRCDNGEGSFYQFSSESAERLKDELSKYPFASEGALVIAEYQSLATEYLFVALVPSMCSITVADDLDIVPTDYLDIGKMDIAARIDLTSFETDKESNRYVSYIKGRVGRKVADFFLDFLQAEVGLDTKQQNQVLMQAVQDFCSDAKLDKEETLSYKKQVANYCKEQMKMGEEVQVRELSGELPPDQNGTSFADYTAEQGYELEESFPGDTAAVRKLTKYVGAGGGINISFDSLLLSERVFYDPETDTLTIKGTPPNLRDQLTRNN
ncbi:nucleoid-associated protein YejK [Vibrio sp. TBV020]|uniref:nucleoid-associated protein YejK n=1 Tax=Vibrio sp. TBV020 TaxID=3137398 RepID=UPI0038CDB988